jgi:hypothetical protein
MDDHTKPRTVTIERREDQDYLTPEMKGIYITLYDYAADKVHPTVAKALLGLGADDTVDGAVLGVKVGSMRREDAAAFTGKALNVLDEIFPGQKTGFVAEFARRIGFFRNDPEIKPYIQEASHPVRGQQIEPGKDAACT